MKKLLYLLGLSLIVFSGCQAHPSGVFSLHGTLTGANGNTVFISTYTEKGIESLDTIQLQGELINYQVKLDQPILVLISIENKNDRVLLFGDNEAYDVEGHIDSLSNVKVTGGKLQEDFSKLVDLERQVQLRQQELGKAYQEASANKDNESLKAIVEEYNSLNFSVSDAKLKYVKANSQSALAAFYVNYLYAKKGLEEMKSGIALLNDTLKSSAYYKILAERVKKLERIEVGQVAPDFTMKDPEGNDVSLSSFKGKYLLIDFWASWCKPCRMENPNVVKMYQKYKDKGFEILGVSLDQRRESWVRAISSDQLNWSHVSDLKEWQNEAAQLYAVTTIPHTVLLDTNGVIIAKNLRGEELAKKIEELVK